MEESAEGLVAALEMEVEENRVIEEKEGGDGTQRSLGALEFLNQDAELSEATPVNARKGFNELSPLVMLWTVQHRWSAGARFAFDFYRHWAQHLLRQTGEPPVTILSREGVTHGDLFLMVLYGITLVPLSEELRAAYPGLLLPFYADDATFDGSARRSAQLLNMLMKRGPDWGYFP